MKHRHVRKQQIDEKRKAIRIEYDDPGRSISDIYLKDGKLVIQLSSNSHTDIELLSTKESFILGRWLVEENDRIQKGFN